MGVATVPAAGGGVTQKTEVFTSTGTFNVPSNCVSVDLFLVAGAGSGGASSASSRFLGGGGGGAGGSSAASGAGGSGYCLVTFWS